MQDPATMDTPGLYSAILELERLENAYFPNLLAIEAAARHVESLRRAPQTVPEVKSKSVVPKKRANEKAARKATQAENPAVIAEEAQIWQSYCRDGVEGVLESTLPPLRERRRKESPESPQWRSGDF